MFYIYVFTNQINNKKYVGQTNNPSRRLREHKSAYQNKNASSYDSVFHRAIRKYGWENFSFEIIDQANTQEEINQLEKYYIKEYDSLVWNNKGYNIELGGSTERDPYSLLYSPEIIQCIKQNLKEGQTYEQIHQKYGITKGYISEINHGHRFKDENEIYPLSKRQETKDSEKVQQVIDLLKNSNLTLNQIAEKTGYHNKGSIIRINNGSYHFNPDLSYPIRKTKAQKNLEAAKLLKETNLTIKEISEKVGLGITTIRNINKGVYRKFEGYTYPIR